MKKGIMILFAVGIFFSGAFSQPNQRIRIAVLEFKLIGNAPAAKMGEGVQEIVMTALSQNNSIEVVERARLEDIIRELSQSGNDLFNPEQAVKLGKLIQAKYVVTGSIVSIGQSMRINARIINVETGSVYKSFSLVNPKTEFLFTTLDNLSQEMEAALLGIGMRSSDGNSPRIEIAFVIDSTGSMNDEIDVVKSRINAILNKTLNASPRPIVKIAVIDYKDEDDEYVNRVFPFTQDITALRKHVQSLQASGGGDYPEQITVSLLKTLNELKWSKRGASKMIFLIGDAPSHKPELITEIIKLANKKHVSIYTIACSGLDASGIELFKNLSKQTNAVFSFLSYRQEYVAQSGERREVITQGRQIFTRRYRPESRSGGTSASAPPAAEAEAARQRSRWGADAARGPQALSSNEYREEAPGRSSSGIEVQETERNRAMAAESVRISGFRRAGNMQNNLDDILINNIRSQAVRDLNIRYRNEIPVNTKFSALVTDKSGLKIWIFFANRMEFEKIKTLREGFTASASVQPAGTGFILFNATVNPRIIPMLGKRTLKAVSENIGFHVKNGVTTEKKWFFTIKWLKLAEN